MEKDDVMKSLKSCLVLNKGSTSLTDLQRDFCELVGREIPYKEFGYDTLQTFLLDIPGVSSCGTEGGVQTFTVNDDKIQHIKNLIEGQKTRPNSRKKKDSDHSYGYTGRNYNLDCNYGRSSKHYHDIVRRFNDHFQDNCRQRETSQQQQTQSQENSKPSHPNYQQSATNNDYSDEPDFNYEFSSTTQKRNHEELSFDTASFSPSTSGRQTNQNVCEPNFDHGFPPRDPQREQQTGYHDEELSSRTEFPRKQQTGYDQEPSFDTGLLLPTRTEFSHQQPTGYDQEPSFDTGLLLPTRTQFPWKQQTRYLDEPSSDTGSFHPSRGETNQNVCPGKPIFFPARGGPKQQQESRYADEEPCFDARPLNSHTTRESRQNGGPVSITRRREVGEINGHYQEEPSFSTGLLLPSKYPNFRQTSQTEPVYSHGCSHNGPTSSFKQDFSQPQTHSRLTTAESVIVLNPPQNGISAVVNPPPGFAQNTPQLCPPPPGFSQEYLFQALNQELNEMNVGSQHLTSNVATFMQNFQVCQPDPEKVKQILLSPTSSQSSGRSANVAHDTIKVTLQNDICAPRNPAPQRKVDRRCLPNATLFGRQLIGDDFLLSLSFMEMGYEFYSMPFAWDLCISGLRITDCLKELRTTRKLRPKVILLVGAMDILSGVSLEKMKLSMQILLRELCGRVHSIVLLTTPPLTLHACFEEFWRKQIEYNSWLKQQHGKSCVQVIDIWDIFVDQDDILSHLFYNDSCVPENMGDSVILWNKAGIAKVVEAIKTVIFS